MTGIDVEIRVTDVFAVVAQARGSIVFASTEYGGAAIGRLGVGARWNF